MTTESVAAGVTRMLSSGSPAARQVFKEILTKGPIGRTQISHGTGLSLAAVTKAVAPLIEAGFVVQGDEAGPRSTAGRPVYPLTVAAETVPVLGIKVNPEEIIAVATTFRAEVTASLHVPLESSDIDAVLDAIAMAARELRGQLGAAASAVLHVGVSVSGDVDTDAGLVRHSPRLGWHNVPLKRLVEERTGLSAHIDNDVRALTFAEEWFGAGLDARSFAIVTIGSGIGCGLYVNGDVISGARSVAGEIGHLPLAPPELVCTCGLRGCVETRASTRSILAELRERSGRPELTMDDAVELARAGDADACEVFGAAGSILGTAIAVMVNLVGPELVLVMGEASPDYDVYEQHLRESFEAHAFGAAAQCQIITRAHRFEDWARGAAASTIRMMVG